MKRFVLFLVVLCVLIVSCDRSDKVFGIDVSQYNGKINWSKVKNQTKTKDPIEFVIIRSTVGVNKDTRYEQNYMGAKKEGFIVGSYHYYRPNENSSSQFENFRKTVKIEKGDILPVVDIEALSTVQGMEYLKKGLRNFVSLCEEEYGVKPIIYTKLSMWNNYLRKDFSDCKLWIAAYSNRRRSDNTVKNADIHQFTKEIRAIPGIPSKFVDGDDVKDINSILYY